MWTSLSLRGRGLFCACLFFTGIYSSVQAGTTVAATRASMMLADANLPPLKLNSHIVDVSINGRVARVSTESIYHNDSARDLEATYLFPLPEGATVERFVMWMDGLPVEGKVAEKARARATYEGIVNKKKDPGLVEQVGENLFQFRVYPVPANGDQRVRIEYSQVLPLTAGSNAMNFTYPLHNESPRVLSAKNFLVNVALEMEGSIAKIESSTHKISQRILTEDPKRATVSIEEAQSSMDRDFSLTITLKDRALPVTSLAFRPAALAGQPAEDGTLILFITPQLPENEEPPAKDIVLVMDTSGSMEGQKIEQARKALNECLTRLRPKDRFALVSFSDFSRCLSEKWSDVNADSIQQARAFVNALQAAGGTNIAEALERAVAFPVEAGRVKHILFATDGIPSVGVQEPMELSKIVVGKNVLPQRVFTLGIGYDVNTALLDRIAAETHGERAYVRENESIDQKVGRLIDRYSAPVLSDVTVEFSSGLGVEQIYPPKTNDLYLGQQLVLTARYRKSGSGQVVLKGKRNGKEIVIEAALNLPEVSAQATGFIPKQWAVRKIGFLLDQMRLYGENAEVKNEVIRLATQFSIVTPYTSFLALEAGDRARFDARTAQGDPEVRTNVNTIEVPPDIMAKAEKGDHFEALNPNSSFGNPDAHLFHSTKDSDDVPSLQDLINAGGPGPGSGGGWGGGVGIGIGNDNGAGRGSFGYRNGGGRKLMIKRYGGSKACESSVDNALRWLAYHQEQAGNWDSIKFGSAEKVDVAITSLSLLTFLSAGHTEKVGEYKSTVRSAVAWLRSRQIDNGRVFEPTDTTKRFAEIGCPDALAALALAEASSMANIPETRAAAQKAIDYCVNVHAQPGGWGFEPNTEPNLIATVGFVTAMKSARVGGLKVDVEAFDKAIKFLDAMERKLKGTCVTYDYSAKEKGVNLDATRAAMGTFARQMLGWKSEDLNETVAGFIERGGQPKWSDSADLPYLYFGTLCAFQQGGDLWKKWNDNIKLALVENQSKDGDNMGSWFAKDSGKNLGRAGQTAFGALCLETYYRYMKVSPEPSSIPSGNSNPQPVQTSPASTSGKDAVDYSEYIRRLKEGQTR